MNFKHTGRALSVLRHIEQLTGVDFAESIGFSHTTIRAIESGNVPISDDYWAAYKRRTGLSKETIKEFIELANMHTPKQLTRAMVARFIGEE